MKFKVGDKVKVFGKTCSNILTEEGIIVKEKTDYRGECWYVSSEKYKEDQYVLSSDMELIETHKFKVGDKVKGEEGDIEGIFRGQSSTRNYCWAIELKDNTLGGAQNGW